jgi:hypothetical protein
MTNRHNILCNHALQTEIRFHFPYNCAGFRTFLRIIITRFSEMSAHMRRGKIGGNLANFSLDTDLEKKRRGPKPRANPVSLRGRADNLRSVLPHVWKKLWPVLERANTEAEVLAALDFAAPYKDYFVSYPALILTILKDPKFPKTARGQINFLADSAAGFGEVSPRRSRDICAAERARRKRKHHHHIVRYEYYIECSCGCTGTSINHACPLCGAEIDFTKA